MKFSNSITPETSLELIIIIIIIIRRRRGYEMEGIIQLRLGCRIQPTPALPISWVPGSLLLRIQIAIPPFLRLTGKVKFSCIAKLQSRFLRLPLSRQEGQILTPFPDTAYLALSTFRSLSS